MRVVQKRKSGTRMVSAQGLVLYVEDDPDNWSVTELFLRRRFNLIWARTDEEACRRIAEHGSAITLILMDIELKGSRLDGIELTRLLRGKPTLTDLPDYARDLPPCEAPIFFVSAYTSRYSERQLLEVGASRLVPKPVDFPSLSLALSEVHVETAEAGALLARLADPGAAEELGCSTRLSERLHTLLESRVLGAGGSPANGGNDHRAYGLEALRAAALTEAVVEQLPAAPAAELLFANVLRRAVAARLLAQVTRLAAPADAFAAGLLLDAGLVPRAQHDLPGALAVARSPAAYRLARERASGEVGHAELAAKMAFRWCLPPALTEAALHHHDTEPPETPLGRIGWLAEIFSGVFEAGDPLGNQQTAIRAAAACGLSSGQANAILEALPDEVVATASSLRRSLPAQPSLSEVIRGAPTRLTELSESYQDLVKTLNEVIEEKNVLAGRLRETNADLLQRADTDLLTGVANRRAFDEALRRAVRQAQLARAPLSVVMIDVDHFKRINDALGHVAGDVVLREVATRLAREVRSGDLVARYGGEEFVVLLPSTSDGQALQIAERLRRAIDETPIGHRHGQVAVAASFGVASCVAPADGQMLVEAADAALYEAKRAGRNAVRLKSA